MKNVIQMQSASDDTVVRGSDRFDIGPTVSLVTSEPEGDPSPAVLRRTRLTALFICPTFMRQPDFVDIFIVFDVGVRGPFPRLPEQHTGTFSILTFVDDVPPGPHTVTVKGFSREPVTVAPRTLTVWETVVERPQVLA